MANYLSNRDGGKTDEHGLLRGLSNALGGSVINGCRVSDDGSTDMVIEVEAGDVAIDSGSGFRYCGWADTAVPITVTTSNPSNPRIDLVVAYIDKTVVQSTTSNNVNALKFKIVDGTAAASPTEPSGATIQTSVGTGNPYTILGKVDVAAAATSIIDSDITDRRDRVPTQADSRSFFNMFGDFVESGLLVRKVSGALYDVTGGTGWIGGVSFTRGVFPSTSATLSRDTYVDVDANGSIKTTEVTNGAASPALASGHMRLGKIVTAASTITSVVTYGKDSLGNFIFPTSEAYGPVSFDPGPTNASSDFVLGNGTAEGQYVRRGSYVEYEIKIVIGSTTSFGTGSMLVQLPYDFSSFYGTNPTTTPRAIIGVGYAEDNVTLAAPLHMRSEPSQGSNMAIPFISSTINSNAPGSGLSSTTPFASWASGDFITLSGRYEIA